MFSYLELVSSKRTPRPQLIDGIMASGTINLIVGDTGIGKTPLGLQLGLAVAAGTEFLDHSTQQGRVLFVDAESGWDEFRVPLERVGQFLCVEPNVPFAAYNRDWDTREILPVSWEAIIEEQVASFRPSLVIIDPLRAIWPLAETKSDECMRMIAWLRRMAKVYGLTWVITHHVRKDSQDVDPRNRPELLDDPQGWLQAAAGTRALVTSADTRIGVAKPPKGGKEAKEVDLLMCGYTRLRGTLPPMRLERVLSDDDSEPVGYRRFVNLEDISMKQKALLDALPATFRMADLKEIAKSSRYAYDLAKKLEGAGLIIKDAARKLYHKAG